MGIENVMTKEYMSIPEHFADAFNFYLFDGQQVIQPENLKLADTTEIGLIFQNNTKTALEKMRDVLKQCVLMKDGNYSYFIFGIENQSDIHYAMPVRNMIYDALNYGHQVTELAKKHRKNKDLKGAEFLSGFSKEDKIKPVVTLVIYFGTEIWNAPRSLKEMFEADIFNIGKFVSDYKLNLMIPSEIEDFTKFHTEFGKLMKYISVSTNRENFNQLSTDETYRKLSVEAARILNECVGTEIKIPEGKETIDMCKAWEEQKLKGLREGLILKIQKKLEKQKTIAQIADELEEEVSTIQELIASMSDKT